MSFAACKVKLDMAQARPPIVDFNWNSTNPLIGFSQAFKVEV